MTQLEQIAKKHNLTIEQATQLKSVMQQKIGDALELKRREVANNFVKTPQAEKDEEV